MPSQKETRVYVGNLPGNCTEKEVQQMFQRYGKIVSLTVKNPRYNDNRASSFAFIEYEDPADADDVVRKKNGMRYDGAKIRVEFPHGNERGRDRDRYSRFGGGGGGSNFNRRGGGGGGGYGNRDKVQRSRYRLRVTGMPLSGSWQDLKDHMREIGEVCFADVDKHGGGVVEFFSGEDMKLAMKKLDNSKFRSHEGDSAYIHLSLDDSDQSRSRSRSHSRSRNSRSRSNDRGSSTPHGHGRRTRRSPTYSPIRHTKGSGSRSRSRSRSPRSRSPAPRKRERSERE